MEICMDLSNEQVGEIFIKVISVCNPVLTLPTEWLSVS